MRCPALTWEQQQRFGGHRRFMGSGPGAQLLKSSRYVGFVLFGRESDGMGDDGMFGSR